MKLPVIVRAGGKSSEEKDCFKEWLGVMSKDRKNSAVIGEWINKCMNERDLPWVTQPEDGSPMAQTLGIFSSSPFSSNHADFKDLTVSEGALLRTGRD